MVRLYVSLASSKWWCTQHMAFSNLVECVPLCIWRPAEKLPCLLLVCVDAQDDML